MFQSETRLSNVNSEAERNISYGFTFPTDPNLRDAYPSTRRRLNDSDTATDSASTRRRLIKYIQKNKKAL